MTYQIITQRIQLVPILRPRIVDWLTLTPEEQGAIKAYAAGDLPLAAISKRGQTFIRRHYEEER